MVDTTITDTPFTGFPDEALAFYEGLEADNSKAYWSDHHEVYERAVQGPMRALMTAVEPEFGPMKLFRPYRDLRFSADKSPYKTAAGAVTLHEDGGHAYYVQISAAGLLVAGGYYTLSRDQLARFRAAIEDDGTGEPLVRVLGGIRRHGAEIGGEQLKRPPRGTDPAHPRADLLRHKGLTAWKRFEPEPWLGTPECLDVICGFWRQIRPLVEWLNAHVGAPEPVEGDPPDRVRR
jgi:uncharacterized protein (TIGR02453 family)